MSVHVYSAPSQPATRYSVDIDGHTIWMTNKKNRAIQADCCGYRRCARNLTVQVYYDMRRFTCVKGKGCKSP